MDRRRLSWPAGAGIALICMVISTMASSLAAPEGPVILTVSGLINSASNTDDVSGSSSTADEPGASESGADAAEPASTFNSTLSFDLAMIERLGLRTVITETPWTDGPIAFRGVLMRDLMARVQATGSHVHAKALDDYVVDIPLQDFHDHDVILATRIGDDRLRIRQNGPLWIIYPWSDTPSLRRPHFYSRSIWQLTSLSVIP